MGSHTIFTLRNSDNIRIQNLDPKQQINITKFIICIDIKTGNEQLENSNNK